MALGRIFRPWPGPKWQQSSTISRFVAAVTHKGQPSEAILRLVGSSRGGAGCSLRIYVAGTLLLLRSLRVRPRHVFGRGFARSKPTIVPLGCLSQTCLSQCSSWMTSSRHVWRQAPDLPLDIAVAIVSFVLTDSWWSVTQRFTFCSSCSSCSSGCIRLGPCLALSPHRAAASVSLRRFVTSIAGGDTRHNYLTHLSGASHSRVTWSPSDRLTLCWRLSKSRSASMRTDATQCMNTSNAIALNERGSKSREMNREGIWMWDRYHLHGYSIRFGNVAGRWRHECC